MAVRLVGAKAAEAAVESDLVLLTPPLNSLLSALYRADRSPPSPVEICFAMGNSELLLLLMLLMELSRDDLLRSTPPLFVVSNALFSFILSRLPIFPEKGMCYCRLLFLYYYSLLL